MIDANVIIAAMLRDSTTRRILIGGGIMPVAPRMVVVEIEKHIEEISARNSLSVETNRRVLRLLASRIRLMPPRSYRRFLRTAYELIGRRDPTDVPYLAVALAVQADGIWSHDADFASQDLFKVYDTRTLKEMFHNHSLESRE